MEAIRELGLLDQAPIDVKGQPVSPREVAVAAMGPRLQSKGHDLVALRVVVRGRTQGTSITHRWELVDRFDDAKGITAMERTTGFSLSITGILQATGAIAPAGVYTPDEAVPGARYVAELARRGIIIRESVTG